MKTIPEIIGGTQALLDVRFDLSACFEESLTDKQKTFLKYFTLDGKYFSASNTKQGGYGAAALSG